MMVLPGRGPVMMNAVQHDVAGRPAERLPLSHRLLVDLAVHHYHHQARDPEGHARADHRVRPVHHKGADLQPGKDTSCHSLRACNFTALIDTRFRNAGQSVQGRWVSRERQDFGGDFVRVQGRIKVPVQVCVLSRMGQSSGFAFERITR